MLVSQDGGAYIKGLVGDRARMYPQSQELVELEVPVQKDIWHIKRWGGRVHHDLERIALAAQHHRLCEQKGQVEVLGVRIALMMLMRSFAGRVAPSGVGRYPFRHFGV